CAPRRWWCSRGGERGWARASPPALRALAVCAHAQTHPLSPHAVEFASVLAAPFAHRADLGGRWSRARRARPTGPVTPRLSTHSCRSRRYAVVRDFLQI